MRASLVLGGLGLVAATAIVTVAVEHRLHAHGVEAHPADHDAEHDEHEAHGRVVLGPEALESAKLELATAGPGQIWTTTTLPGEATLNADAVAHISPPVSGTLREVRGELGTKVKRGDVLAVLESRELAEISREARAAGKRFELAQAEQKRVAGLVSEGVLPEKERAAADGALEQARIARDAATEMLSAAGTGSGARLSLRAPIDGVIIEKHATLGEVVKDDTRVFVVADLDSLWIDLAVYPKDLGLIEVGQRARVQSNASLEPAVGTIAYVGALASSADRTASARVVLKTPGPGWKPGLFVTAEVALRVEDAEVVIDEAAVQTLEGRPSVFVEEDGAFEARPIVIGAAGVDAAGARVVAVTAGLARGARYVRVNAFVLKAELGKGEAEHEH